MDITEKNYKSIQDVFAKENKQAKYLYENLFFNPSNEKSTYLIKEEDLLLHENIDGTFRWTPAPSYTVGILYRLVIKQHTRFKAIATPVKFEFDIEDIYSCSAYFGWGALGLGHGQMSFHKNKEDGQIEFDTEMMGKETTRLMLHQFVDFIVDNGTSSDWKK